MAFALQAFQSSAGLPPTGRLDTQTLEALASSGSDFAFSAPAPRGYETWAPVKKFKHGKWKMKWKKYQRDRDNIAGDEDQQANSAHGALRY
jgi:peptidoglycan hydrolase-like protein with peptidoglycan-binding domain